MSVPTPTPAPTPTFIPQPGALLDEMPEDEAVARIQAARAPGGSGLLAAFPPLKNDTALRAAKGLPVSHTPVWAMRQAGRYLPEFRSVRSLSQFFEVCRSPSLASEVTLQPLRRFALDAAIIFSDILVIPQALGVDVVMTPGIGPQIPNRVATPADVETIVKFVGEDYTKCAQSLSYVWEAVALTRMRMNGHCPLFGFCGAPWTIMAYMVQGGGSRNWDHAKAFVLNHPEAAHQLLHVITEVSIEYLVGKVHAGAQILQVFDSNAGELPPHQLKEFSLPYLARIAEGVKARLAADGVEAVPLVVFARGAMHSLDLVAKLGYDVLGIDWTIDLKSARAKAGPGCVLQGNLDPCTLFAPPEVIRQEVRRMLADNGDGSLIANLGHGMLPNHSPEHLGVFIEEIHAVSRAAKST